jgi:hypothetical protein
MLTRGVRTENLSHIAHNTSACSLPLFPMKPGPIPQVVNFAQTPEGHKIRKVAALKES